MTCDNTASPDTHIPKQNSFSEMCLELTDCMQSPKVIASHSFFTTTKEDLTSSNRLPPSGPARKHSERVSSGCITIAGPTHHAENTKNSPEILVVRAQQRVSPERKQRRKLARRDSSLSMERRSVSMEPNIDIPEDQELKTSLRSAVEQGLRAPISKQVVTFNDLTSRAEAALRRKQSVTFGKAVCFVVERPRRLWPGFGRSIFGQQSKPDLFGHLERCVILVFAVLYITITTATYLDPRH